MKGENKMRKKIVAITMDEDVWNNAKEYAKTQNRNLSNFLTYLVLKEINTGNE